MLSVTADTNIYISGLQFGGLPERFLRLAAATAFRLDVSDAILSETMRVLRDKFEWDLNMLRRTEEDLRSYSHHVSPTQTLQIITADLSDNRILECAVAAGSEFIVSGDTRHVLPLGNYAGISILSGADFLYWLDRK